MAPGPSPPPAVPAAVFDGPIRVAAPFQALWHIGVAYQPKRAQLASIVQLGHDRDEWGGNEAIPSGARQTGVRLRLHHPRWTSRSMASRRRSSPPRSRRMQRPARGPEHLQRRPAYEAPDDAESHEPGRDRGMLAHQHFPTTSEVAALLTIVDCLFSSTSAAPSGSAHCMDYHGFTVSRSYAEWHSA